MTQKVIIHVGPHKTGTTSIQNMLYAHSLGDGENFVYPFTCPDQTGQHDFARTASDPENPTFIEMLTCLSRLEKTFVLSSEELSFLPVDSLQKIREALPSAEFTIVYYQRNILSILHSWWQELVKHGGVEDFHKYVLSVISMPGRLHLLVPDLLLSNWASVFGRDSIKIFLYDRISDVAKQFAFDLLGLIISSSKRTEFNKSFDYIDCEMIRLWNVCGFIGVDAIQSQKYGLMRDLVAARAKECTESLALNFDIEEFSNIENTLISRWGDRIEGFTGSRLFTLREKTYTYISSDFWTDNPDLVAAMCVFAKGTAGRAYRSSATVTASDASRSCETNMDAWGQMEIILGAARQREQLLRCQLAKEAERSQALEIVISTLVASMNWRGLDRSKFQRLMTDVARSTPNVGRAANRHEIYLHQSHKILCAK
ncbi:hypothetical protein LOK46_06040 [Methylobacterium sp. NMS14P]|uniref:hypothetical protein n=1 Tax=Methylobacterium sp. NMS14P TaxID=2894310 RepID=UPI00235A454D|nr:hypothetical protein [Methylobacterium sp. NMS14P]WCS26393.1 hypothetical protein LOK46_06040 [Methylobacterium sp. NMS14P]